MRKKLIVIYALVAICSLSACSKARDEGVTVDYINDVQTVITDTEYSSYEEATTKVQQTKALETVKKDNASDKETEKKSVALKTTVESLDNSSDKKDQANSEATKQSVSVAKNNPSSIKPKQPQMVSTQSSVNTSSSSASQQTTKATQTTTTVQQTTTQAQTTKSSTTGGKPSYIGTISLDITPSDKATSSATAVVGNIIKSNMNDYDRVKAIHDWLVKNVDYGGNTDNKFTAEGALIDKKAVCQGYAEAFELLCSKSGVQSLMVYGDAKDNNGIWVSHAWNYVNINGKWYHIDCTWDDPIINGAIVIDGSNISYDYFLLTDSEILSNHRIDTVYTKKIIECKSTEFVGYASRLSAEIAEEYAISKAKSENANFVQVSNAKGFYDAVKNWVAVGTYNFAIVVPKAANVDSKKINDAILEGTKAANIKGSYSYGYSSQVSDVYNIFVYKMVVNITKQ